MNRKLRLSFVLLSICLSGAKAEPEHVEGKKGTPTQTISLVQVDSRFKGEKRLEPLLKDLAKHVAGGKDAPYQYVEKSSVCVVWVGPLDKKLNVGRYLLMHGRYSILLIDGEEGLKAFLDRLKKDGVEEGKLPAGITTEVEWDKP